MALPKAREARLFYRVAQQRLLDAQLLLGHGRTTGAVYLAGYAVECILKALILSRLTAKARSAMAESFRGMRGHDFGWLKFAYFANHGESFPEDVTRAFERVRTWSTILRYQSKSVSQPSAERFLQSAELLVQWAGRRL
jgi:HEPN domain-containing protein